MNSMFKLFAAAIITLNAAAAAAQPISFADGWIQVATAVFPGGQTRMDVPFNVDVETRTVGVVVPSFCAPRALASRALVIDEFSGFWPRYVGLRNVRQEYVGAYIHAVFAVDSDFGGDVPLVSGLRFSLAQASAGAARPCRLDFYALPSQD